MSTAFVWLLKKAARHAPKIDTITGNKTLYHGITIFIIGILSIAMAIFITWLSMTLAHPTDQTEWILVIVLTAFFGVSGIAVVFEWFKAKIIVTEKEIIAKAAWPWYPKKLLWQDIESITYSYLLSSFVIRGKNHITIRIAVFTYGISYLLECCTKYLNPEIYQDISGWMRSIKKYM